MSHKHKYGTTPQCGPICDDLIAARNGHVRHEFVVLLLNCPEDQLYRSQVWAWRAAGHAAKSRAAPSNALKDPTLQACYKHHRGVIQLAAVDRAEKLKQRLWDQSEANLFKLVAAQKPTSQSRRHLKQILTQGVETRDPVTGEVKWREPTEQELQKAIDAAARIRLKRPDELPEELQMVIDEFKEDRHGNLSYKIDRHAARRLLAQISGWVKDTVEIQFVFQEKLHAAQRWFEAVMLYTLSKWAPEVEEPEKEVALLMEGVERE